MIAVVDEHGLGLLRQDVAQEGHYATTATRGTVDAEQRHFVVPVNRGIVASPAALIPSRRTTLSTVSQMIFRSSQRLRLSTYQTSSANF